MKLLQIIILLTIALLYSCSLLRLKEKVIDQTLKEMFEEQLREEDPSDYDIRNFFEKLGNYAEESNPMLAEKLEKIMKEAEEIAERLQREQEIEPKEEEELDKIMNDFLRKKYQDIMDNYESFLLVDQENVGIDFWKIDELMEYAGEIRVKLEEYAEDNSELKDQLESIMNKYDKQMNELTDGRMSKKEEKIASIKIYELFKQLISELKVIKRTLEDDS